MHKVLVIDDFEPVRKVAKRILERLGYQVFQAVDGREGLDVFEKENPDVIITDLQMPRIDGAGVLVAVKQRSPRTEVVVLTGFADPSTEKELKSLGAFACLKKPLEVELIIQTLREIQEKTKSLSVAGPRIFLAVESEMWRGNLSTLLTSHGFETVFGARGSDIKEIYSTDAEVVVVETRSGSEARLTAVLEAKKAADDFEVLLLLTKYGAGENAAKEALSRGIFDCLQDPFDPEAVLSSVRRASNHAAFRRSRLYRRRREDAKGSLTLTLGPRDEITADSRGAAPLLSRLGSLPLPFLFLSESLDVVFVSPPLKGMVGFDPDKLDERFMDALRRRGLRLPPLDELYRNLARMAGREDPLLETADPSSYGWMSIVKVKAILERPDPQNLLLLIFSSGNPGEAAETDRLSPSPFSFLPDAPRL